MTLIQHFKALFECGNIISRSTIFPWINLWQRLSANHCVWACWRHHSNEVNPAPLLWASDCSLFLSTSVSQQLCEELLRLLLRFRRALSAEMICFVTPCCFKSIILLISALCRSVFGAFCIIILLHNERLLIAFLVRLIYHMFLLHYRAMHLKKKSFNFTVYIFTYKHITCFSWMYFKTIQRAMYIILHDHFRFCPTFIFVLFVK